MDLGVTCILVVFLSLLSKLLVWPEKLFWEESASAHLINTLTFSSTVRSLERLLTLLKSSSMLFNWRSNSWSLLELSLVSTYILGFSFTELIFSVFSFSVLVCSSRIWLRVLSLEFSSMSWATMSFCSTDFFLLLSVWSLSLSTLSTRRVTFASYSSFSVSMVIADCSNFR